MKKVIVALCMLVMCLVVQAQDRTDKWGVPYVKLNNGMEMPRFGLGTYAVSNDDCKQACLVALKEGLHTWCSSAAAQKRCKSFSSTSFR